MKEFEKKAKRKKRLCSNFVIIILAIILSLLIKSTINVYIKARQGRTILETATTDMKELEDRADKLKEDIDYLQSDIGKEERVRSNFFVAKEGEEAVFILDDGVEKYIEPEEKSRLSNFWESFLNLFK